MENQELSFLRQQSHLLVLRQVEPLETRHLSDGVWAAMELAVPQVDLHGVRAPVEKAFTRFSKKQKFLFKKAKIVPDIGCIATIVAALFLKMSLKGKKGTKSLCSCVIYKRLL